jgi:hypothetical protein
MSDNMATCSDRGDCNPNGFVLKSFKPQGMNAELYAVQCPHCGRTYGIVEDYNFRSTYTQLARAIKAVADHLGVKVTLHTGSAIMKPAEQERRASDNDAASTTADPSP